ncbi:hypothetical protein [Caenibacillus caldisaponilyticus]|uniref:hypothetical protein n=1 Tax=Caenibacillus caldisaponilyticus TaxID=1674942 RepID=UPI0009884E5C|nr:hypothetical protein [Caenibacillus caldisaponilyticus]
MFFLMQWLCLIAIGCGMYMILEVSGDQRQDERTIRKEVTVIAALALIAVPACVLIALFHWR